VGGISSGVQSCVQTILEVRKAADQRWSRVELGCCGDLSSVPLVFALVVSKEEDRCWFLHRFILYFQFCKVCSFVTCNLFLSYE
jgi:hypothetical protein